MPSDFYYAPSKNSIQKTLGAQLLNTASTGDAISLSDVDGIQNKPGVLVINRVDSNGTATPSAREYISFTGTSGSTVLIETRNVDNSASAKTHAVGSVVEFIPDVVWAQRLIDQALVEHNVDGTHDSATVTTLKATQAEVATGTEDAKIVTPLAAAPYGNSSMSRQAIINGGCIVGQRAAATLSTTKAYGGVDRIYGIAEGTVGAGTITQITNSTIGTTGYALKLAGVTLTGSGKVKAGYRMEAKDAVNFKNLVGSFSVRVLHDVGSAKTYTIYVNKANAADNFSAVTAIGNNGGTSVESATGTLINYENISLGDCSNGLEIIVESNCGAVTTKNFEFTEFQFNKGSAVLTFQPKSFEEELRACQRYYWKTFPYNTAPAQNSSVYLGAITKAVVTGGAGVISDVFVQFPTRMRTTPTALTFYNPGAANTKWRNRNDGADSGTPATPFSEVYENGFMVYNTQVAGDGAGEVVYVHATAESEL